MVLPMHRKAPWSKTPWSPAGCSLSKMFTKQNKKKFFLKYQLISVWRCFKWSLWILKEMEFQLILSFPLCYIKKVASQSGFIKIPKECRPLTTKGVAFHKLTKSSLLKTGLTQNTVYEKVKLVPARTLTLMFQCPPYGRCFERYTKWNIYTEPTKKTLIYNFSFQQNMLRAMMSWIYWE